MTKIFLSWLTLVKHPRYNLSCVFYAIFKILSNYFQSIEAYFVYEKKLNTTN